MFSKSKPEPSKKRSRNLSQFGLIDISDDFDPTLGYDGGGDADDSDLEAELAAIAGNADNKPKQQKSKSKLMPPGELDKMIADSLKDVDSDDNDVDINDSELLGELEDIAGVTLDKDTEAVNKSDIQLEEQEQEQDQNENTPKVESEAETKADMILPTTTFNTIVLLKQRLEMYKQAEGNAKAKGESAKVRRFNRGLRTLNELLKQANAGKSINMEDIPPEVSVQSSTVTSATANETSNQTSCQEDTEEGVSKPFRKAPAPPTAHEFQNETTTIAVEDPRIKGMRVRQQEYKAAALQSKRSGDTAMALQYLKVVKQFDIVIQMCIDGQQVDLSDMPPPPSEFKEFMEKLQAAASERQQNAEDITATAEESEQKPQTGTESEVQVTAPATVLEALEQRLTKYKTVEASAKIEGNASKARRFGRIVKQYEDAIRAHKAGRTVAYDELPVPPGFGPLPLSTDNSNPNKLVTPPTPSKPVTGDSTEGENVSGDDQTISSPPSKKPSTPRQDLTTRTSGNQQKNNLAEQQMKILLERQKEFKIAAIEAKKAGEIDQAKEYLKIYKGFDGLLNAASSGLPVDLSTLPIPPNQRENLEASFAIITTEDCDPNDDIADIRIRVEEQLAKQLMMCKNTRDHHKAMGDVAGMNRFENLALGVQKDLDLVRFSKKNNFPLPKFHYEKRSFNIVHCNTDLTDNEMEVMVVRGLNYNVPNPKDVDTYVKVECPLLNDETFKGKTNLIKDTDSPEYEQRFKVDIIRGNRQFNRIFKRHGIKFEIYSRGCSLDCCGLSRILPICCFRGFLRSDILIGTVLVKLQPLETKCDIHDTFNLMDGRKVVGGKLEIKIRLRNPILTKQIEHLEEKWLVLDE